jgi:hypothetical protein
VALYGPVRRFPALPNIEFLFVNGVLARVGGFALNDIERARIRRGR